jgi:hypothetical protein
LGALAGVEKDPGFFPFGFAQGFGLMEPEHIPQKL